MAFAPGDLLGPYALLERLGAGGQGAVWRAAYREGGGQVALKLIALEPRASAERARREAKALAQLSHPSLPRCLGAFEDERRQVLGLALEIVEGTDLASPSAPSLDRVAKLCALAHISSALAYLHGLGIVHRDVKLDNVVVRHDFAARPADPARCKLIDLGIATLVGNPVPLTRVGHPGTVPYLAPEALDPVSFRAPAAQPALDVFAFGVMGWLLLRGRHPSGLLLDADAGDFIDRYLDCAESPASWVRGEALTDPVERILASCLSLQVAARPRDATPIARELATLAQLDATTTSRTLPGAPIVPAATRAEPPSRSSDRGPTRALLLGGAATALLMGAAGLAIVLGREGGSELLPAPSVSAAVQVERARAAGAVRNPEPAESLEPSPTGPVAVRPGCFVVLLHGRVLEAADASSFARTRALLRSRRTELAGVRVGLGRVGDVRFLVGSTRDEAEAKRLAAVMDAEFPGSEPRKAQCLSVDGLVLFPEDWSR